MAFLGLRACQGLMAVRFTDDRSVSRQAPLAQAEHVTGSLVSICIPAYEGRRWIRGTIVSALDQDYRPLEVIVCDDASSDGTVEEAQAVAADDERVRVVRNPRRLGIAGNWNRCVGLARGEYVKLLMQDDLLEPDSASVMVSLLDRYPTVGFAFSPRYVRLEDPTDGNARRWKQRYGTLHDRLEPLAEFNDGRRLYDAVRRDRFIINCFGEPSAVMVRRTAFEQVGLFNRRLHQLLDEEMWLRLAFFYDVGFVREPLATVRVHRRSATSRNVQAGAAWLDPLWLLDGLKEHPEIRPTIGPRLVMRVGTGTLSTEVRRVLAGGYPALSHHMRDLHHYVQFQKARPRAPLHQALGHPRTTAVASGADATEGAESHTSEP